MARTKGALGKKTVALQQGKSLEEIKALTTKVEKPEQEKDLGYEDIRIEEFASQVRNVKKGYQVSYWKLASLSVETKRDYKKLSICHSFVITHLKTGVEKTAFLAMESKVVTPAKQTSYCSYTQDQLNNVYEYMSDNAAMVFDQSINLYDYTQKRFKDNI